MKVALLGLTHPHSAILLATLQHLPEVTNIVLWDADPGVLARQTAAAGSKVTTTSADLDGVLADSGLKFAVLCVRHDESAALAIRVLKAGKHLVVEKPVGLTAAEITEVQSAADRAGVVSSVLYARRFHPCMVAARALVQTGELGMLMTAETRFLTTQVKFRDPKSWLFQRSQSGGGMLLWLGCHCLDLMYHVTGDEISEVGAFLATRSGEDIDVEDTVALALKFRSGAVGTFHAGYTLAYSGKGYVNSAGYDSYLGFNYRNGRIVWPDLNPRLMVERPPAAGGSPLREEKFELRTSPAYGGAPGEDFFRQFLAAIEEKAAAPTMIADALRTARIVEAAEESSRLGKIVPIQSNSGGSEQNGSIVNRAIYLL